MMQCRGAYPGYMQRYFRENDITLTITDGDRKALKAPAGLSASPTPSLPDADSAPC
jgi:hypothetical protein